MSIGSSQIILFYLCVVVATITIGLIARWVIG
jgi:hypothetical protein